MTDYRKMKVVELRAKLKGMGLSSSGLKAELVARLGTQDSGQIPASFTERETDKPVSMESMNSMGFIKSMEFIESMDSMESMESMDSAYWSFHGDQWPLNNQTDAGDDSTDVGTVFSATTFTSPEVAQDCIIHICEDIYNNIRLEGSSSQYSYLIKTMPELIEAFAIRLGSYSSHEISWRVMHFVYEHRRELSSILKERLAEPKLNVSEKRVMPLVDKMSLWTKGDRQIGENDRSDHLAGIDDLKNDKPLSTPELPIYRKAILDSPAYEWLLNTMKNKLALEWGSTDNGVDKIRGTILRTLRPRKICSSEPPKTFTTTVVFQRGLLELLQDQLRTANGSERVSSLANIRVLSFSGGTDLQLSTIEQYIHQVWPEFGTKLLDGFQWLLDGIRRNSDKRYSASFVYGDGNIKLSYDGIHIYADIHGPAYVIAQCAEQLAWLETVLGTCCESPYRYMPSLVEIGELKFLAHTYPEALTGPFVVPWFIAREKTSSGLSFLTLVSGYPTSRRPEGFSGVEMPFGFPDSSAKIRSHAYNGHVTLHAGSLTCSFVKRKANVWLWHVVNSTDTICLCRRSSALEGISGVLDQGIIDIVSHHRHIIGDCGACVEQNKVSGYEGHLGCLTMPHTNNNQLVKDDKSLTEYHSPSNSADSDWFSFSSFSEVGARGTIPLDSDLTVIINNTATRLLTECNIRTIPLQAAELNDGDSPNMSQKGSGRISYACHDESNQFVPGSLQKRKLNQRDEDDKDDDIREGRHSKKSRYETEPEQKLFACPFWKINSIKYQACFQLKLLTSSRVKQHLNRNHIPRFYCQVCYLLFTDDKMQESHVIQRACNRELGARLDGILPEQQYQLSRKPKSALTEKEKWFRIWEILFPEEKPPLSPYIDSRLADCCARFREHWQNRGAEILSVEILDSGIFPRETADEDKRQELLREVLARGFDMIWESWNVPITPSHNKSIPTSTTSELSAPLLSRHPNIALFTDSTTSTSSFADSALGSRGDATGSSSTANAYSDIPLFPSPTGTPITQYHNPNTEAPPTHTFQSFPEIPSWEVEFPEFLSGFDDLTSRNTHGTVDPSQISSLMPESSDEPA
ncbi:hypothetical protein F5B21DRAFT_453141 [Xylaria acuta]|nr:hypothetical protein F5B21DRAFT_453141 [Xylaria acuta]